MRLILPLPPQVGQVCVSVMVPVPPHKLHGTGPPHVSHHPVPPHSGQVTVVVIRPDPPQVGQVV